MAEFELSDEELRKLRSLIARRGGVLDRLGQENLLDDAGLHAVAAGKLTMGAPAETFSRELVRVLQNDVGTLEFSGKPALEPLLRVLRRRVRGHEADAALVERLLAGGGKAQAASSADDAGDRKATILFMAANSKRDPVRTDKEARTVEERLHEGPLRDRFALRQAHAVRWTDLSRLLLQHAPAVAHFAGHGKQGGQLLLGGGDGTSKAMDIEMLARTFGAHSDHLRCVLLNACWSKTQAEAIARHIDVVIGMREPVFDGLAIHFAAGFYRGLSFGQPLGRAFDAGCTEMGSAARRDNARVAEIPQILVRDGVDASRLWLVTP